jgi:hypothetical protein
MFLGSKVRPVCGSDNLTAKALGYRPEDRGFEPNEVKF